MTSDAIQAQSMSTDHTSYLPFATPVTTVSLPALEPSLASEATSPNTYTNFTNNASINTSKLLGPAQQWMGANNVLEGSEGWQSRSVAQTSFPLSTSTVRSTFWEVPQDRNNIDLASQIGFQMVSPLRKGLDLADPEQVFQGITNISICDRWKEFQNVEFQQDNTCEKSVIHPQTLRRLGLVPQEFPPGGTIPNRLAGGSLCFSRFITVAVKVGSPGAILMIILVHDDAFPYIGIDLVVGSRFTTAVASFQQYQPAIQSYGALNNQAVIVSSDNTNEGLICQPRWLEHEASTSIGSPMRLFQRMLSVTSATQNTEC